VRRKFRIVGINFDHMHMGDNLRFAHAHPDCEIVGICDEQPQRMAEAIGNFGLRDEQVFTDAQRCMERTDPDLVIACPATAHHAAWVERLAPFGKPIMMEKPFAASLDQADRMIAAAKRHGIVLAINWPLAWHVSHRTAKRLIDDGAIGRVIEVHYYDGNRGPLWHGADKHEKTAEQVDAEKPESWFYRREAGGGSLLDYLGYGATLGTWYMDGEKPLEVTAVIDEPAGLEVDEHSITIARYERGLSKFETRWGTFTDPWTHQPQPACGFIFVGEAGTLSSCDYARSVRIQTRECPEGRDVPADVIEPPFQNPLQYLVDRLTRGAPIEGPLSIEISRIGQQIVDTAMESARRKRTLELIG
jgi:glucose-fructose oxidoreductase